MPKRSSKSPDPNKRAFQVVQDATEEAEANHQVQPEPPPDKNPAAVALGRRGGKKGGPARAEKLSKEQLSEIGKKGAAARWRKLNSD